MFRNILLSENYQLTDFDVLIQSCVGVIQRIAFSYLCKTCYVIIIPFLNFHLEKFGEKEEELQTIEKSFPGEIKSIFHIFLRTSCNIKNSKKIPANCPRRNLL